jgi:hypothetical protein
MYSIASCTSDIDTSYSIVDVVELEDGLEYVEVSIDDGIVLTKIDVSILPRLRDSHYLDDLIECFLSCSSNEANCV